jgi:Zn-dependent M28 family amino/carboxypeptidase
MRPLLLLILLSGCPRSTPPPGLVTPPRGPDAVTRVLGEISHVRMMRDVEKLASFGTRHTLSDTQSESRGIGAARRWIKAELEKTGLTASFDAHKLAADGKRIPEDTEIVNVMAILPGASDRRFYVVGHYDSRATDVMDRTSDAPGANDDASGVAVVLELARVLAKHKLQATIVFLATAGEEQGLYGARLHAQAAKDQQIKIAGVLSNDIVGDPGKDARRVRIFSEADTAYSIFFLSSQASAFLHVEQPE